MNILFEERLTQFLSFFWWRVLLQLYRSGNSLVVQWLLPDFTAEHPSSIPVWGTKMRSPKPWSPAQKKKKKKCKVTNCLLCNANHREKTHTDLLSAKISKDSLLLNLKQLFFFNHVTWNAFSWLTCCYSFSIKQTMRFIAEKTTTINMHPQPECPRIPTILSCFYVRDGMLPW